MTTTQRAATDLLSAAKAMLLKDCPDNPRCEPGHCKWMGDVEQELAAAIAAAENADTLGGMIDKALTAREKLARLWETDSVPEDARKSYEARLEAIYAQMREMDLWRVETHSCYAQIKGESVEIGRII